MEMFKEFIMHFYIFHGTYGSPEENWFPWLKKELEELGQEVTVPQLPTPLGQSLENWLRVIEREEFDENAVIVAHSISCAFALRKLELLEKPIRASFLVAGFTKKLEVKEVDDLNFSFFSKPFNWKKINENCSEFFVYASKNDPYVPFFLEKELADVLKVKPIIIEDAGHFNEKAGFKTFPLLLENIKTLI